MENSAARKAMTTSVQMAVQVQKTKNARSTLEIVTDELDLARPAERHARADGDVLYNCRRWSTWSPPTVFCRSSPIGRRCHAKVVLITGACELAGSIALMTKRWRRVAGWMLALYAICVFPPTSSMPSTPSTFHRCLTAGGIMALDWRFSRFWCGGRSIALA